MPANDSYFRSLKKLHVVFALSSIGLLVVALATMSADHADEWRDTQKTFDKINELRLNQQIEEQETYSQELKIEQLEADLEQADRQLEENTAALREIIAAIEFEVNELTAAVKIGRAERGKAEADYGLAIRDGLTGKAERLLENFNAKKAQVAAKELELEQKEAELSAEMAKLAKASESRDEIAANLKQERAELDRLVAARNKVAPDSFVSSVKRKVMQWPIIDGFNSPHKINQIWLPDLKITLGMARTARFDRCTTCHLGIDQLAGGTDPLYPPMDADHASLHNASHGVPDKDVIKKWVEENKYPQPYASHPRLDLFLSSTSPHPMAEFGCTGCHDGQGSGTSFNNAAHTPNNPNQNEVWADNYHYHANHYWEYPMLPKRFRESSCLKCHHDVAELETSPEFGNSAPQLVNGYHTIENYGCFGCHEIHGYAADKRIGPDLRLEPNWSAVADRIRADAVRMARKEDVAEAAKKQLQTIAELGETIATNPLDSDESRAELQTLLSRDKTLPDPLFSGRVHGLIDGLADVDHPGNYRKVGPSLRHLHRKSEPAWVAYWTERPGRFRPSTKMPQFFHLTNQQDDAAKVNQPVEIAAITSYLMSKSQEQVFDYDTPAEGYEPQVARGKQLFAEKGCLSCHSHKDFPTITKDFGPELSRIFDKVLPPEDGGEYTTADAGFRWVYSWVRNPQKYHRRSKMPNLYLTPFKADGKDEMIDPAADIAAYLLDASAEEIQEAREQQKKVAHTAATIDDQVLDKLTRHFLMKTLTKAQTDKFMGSAPGDPEVKKKVDAGLEYPYAIDEVKGDEIEFLTGLDSRDVPESEWRKRKLNYVGRRTIARYGCYGCHDIPGFEDAKPIGTNLQDWGRKDPHTLANEHIAEFLNPHAADADDEEESGEQSVHDQVELALKRAASDNFDNEEQREEELAQAYFYDSLLHHGRPGFLWQKLRQPRSYDFKKTETKEYDERLKMPKFPFDRQQVEAVTTFVLGLVAEPPAPRYVFQPTPEKQSRYAGEFVLKKYNCASCHVLDLPEVRFTVERNDKDTPATYSDYVGMTLPQMVEWLAPSEATQARVDQLLDGSLAQADWPKEIRELEKWCQTFGVAGGVQDIVRQAHDPVLLKYRQNLTAWFQGHPQVMLTGSLAPDEIPDGVAALLKVKPPHSGTVSETSENGDAIVRFRGMLAAAPDPEEDPEYQLYLYKNWETLDIDGRVMLPAKNISFSADRFLGEKPGRGGDYASWLVGHLLGDDPRAQQDSKKRAESWQSVPPPLYLEGQKVQTGWLYSFLKNPETIRHETVLRMPQFNMSDAEARILANYFAAVDGTKYPYQDVPQQDPGYAERMTAAHEDVLNGETYLDESWKMLGKNALCVGCHSVMGREFVAPDPTQVVHGPDLGPRVTQRFRPEWLELWLYKPGWVTPYTGMPAPHTQTVKGFLGDDKSLQTLGLRDALLNYNMLMERNGKIEAPKPIKPDAAAAN